MINEKFRYLETRGCVVLLALPFDMSICGFVTGVASSTRLSPTFPARRSFECRHAIKKYDLTVFAKCDSSVGALDWYNSQLDISQLGVCRLLRNAEAVGETVSDFLSSYNSELLSCC